MIARMTCDAKERNWENPGGDNSICRAEFDHMCLRRCRARRRAGPGRAGRRWRRERSGRRGAPRNRRHRDQAFRRLAERRSQPHRVYDGATGVERGGAVLRLWEFHSESVFRDRCRRRLTRGPRHRAARDPGFEYHRLLQLAAKMARSLELSVLLSEARFTLVR